MATKPIFPTLHGLIDYGSSALIGCYPVLFDLQNTYALVCWVLAGGYFVVALLTNMPLGFINLIPYPIHGKLELVSSFAFIASPWLFGFAHNATARNLFMATGLLFLLVYFLTDWSAVGQRDVTKEELADLSRRL